MSKGIAIVKVEGADQMNMPAEATLIMPEDYTMRELMRELSVRGFVTFRVVGRMKEYAQIPIDV